jgi:hypothetical protein
MYQSLQGVISALHVLVALAGLVVCLVNLHRSRWAWLMAAAFGFQALMSIGYPAIAFLMSQQVIGYEGVQPAYVLLGLLGLLASAAIVGGLALVFSGLPAPAPTTTRRRIVEPEP